MVGEKELDVEMGWDGWRAQTQGAPSLLFYTQNKIKY